MKIIQGSSTRHLQFWCSAMVCLASLAFFGCASSPSSAVAKRWSAPPMPTDPPPIPGGLALRFPPLYPYENRIAGLRGEVLFKLTIADNKIVDYSVIRSSNDLFEKSAMAVMARQVTAPEIPPGTYSFSVAFCAPGEEDFSRPATFWVAIDRLGDQ